MNKFILELSLICICLFSVSAYALPNFNDNEDAELLAKKITDAMTDEELLSQIFMFGWKKEEPNQLLFDWIEKRGLGNIKIFGWNTKDSIRLAKAINLLQEKSINGRFGIPLLVATDQEGGLVRHVKGLATHTTGNLALGASSLPFDAYWSGYYISMELKALGINLNFAPAVDLYTNYDSSVIGIRSFGESSEATARLAVAFMKGAKDAGLLSTAKHFPGHGDTEHDSHGRLPVIDADKTILLNREFVPFQALIEGGIPAIMTAHINYSSLSENGEPATFSRYILKNILREKLGFKGIIITDDIMMAGAINYAKGLAFAVQKAIEAGNNIVESSRTPFLNEEVWLHNITLMKNDENFYLAVKDSATRLITLKLKYFKSKNHVPIFADIENIPKNVPNKDGQKFFVGMAARSVTVVRGMKEPCPDSNKEKILIASNTQSCLKYGKVRFKHARTCNLADALSNVQYANTIIFCLEDNYSLTVLQSLLATYPNKRFIVISAMSPVFLKKNLAVNDVIAIYSDSPFSFMTAFSCIAGDFVAKGRMPLHNIK